MKIFFDTRSQAREFANRRDSYKFKDMGADSPADRRWAVAFGSEGK